MSFRYSCEYCGTDEAVLHPFHFEDVCVQCGEYVHKIHMCETCDSWPAFDGIDECVHCSADYYIEHPEELNDCTRLLQLEIAKVFAARLKPYLRSRQAA